MNVKEVKRLDDGRPYAIEARSENEDLQVHMKWDGCIDLRKYNNGTTPENHKEADCDYIHICEVKEFIVELQKIVNIAENVFHEDDFKDYWE